MFWFRVFSREGKRKPFYERCTLKILKGFKHVYAFLDLLYACILVHHAHNLLLVKESGFVLCVRSPLIAVMPLPFRMHFCVLHVLKKEMKLLFNAHI